MKKLILILSLMGINFAFADDDLQRAVYCWAVDQGDNTRVTVIHDHKIGLALATVSKDATRSTSAQHVKTVAVEVNAIPGSLVYGGKNLTLSISMGTPIHGDKTQPGQLAYGKKLSTVVELECEK